MATESARLRHSARRLGRRLALVTAAIVAVALSFTTVVWMWRSPETHPSQPASPGGSGAVLRPVDGGPDYYGRFSPSLPTDPSFFPIGVWFESVTDPADAAQDQAAGINTYVELTSNSDLRHVRNAGMYAITSPINDHGRETVGWLMSDEADMWGGAGDAAWTGRGPGQGDVCRPKEARCGYSIQREVRAKLPRDNRLRLANYGKGVAFWQSDAEASRFVNEFQDIVSIDNYWFTDLGICSQYEGGSLFDASLLVPGATVSQLPAELCHHAANYGRTVKRVRSLIRPEGTKPVWNFVEVGHPSSEPDDPAIKPAEITAAVWSSLINGARGIIYFNHSFGGPCESQHALREPCYAAVRASVTQVNQRIKALAPILNAPFADGVTRVSSGVDVATKWHNGHFYVLAASNGRGPQDVTFTMSCVGDAHATVLDEGRGLTATRGAFTDRFAEGGAVHIYRIDGGSSCGAY